MKITKIKRNLAKIGIGNPLNILLYTSKEITEMKKRGEIIDFSNPEIKQRLRDLAKRGRPKTRGEGYANGYASGFIAGNKKHKTKIFLSIDDKLKKVIELWCEWNTKAISSNDFAGKFGDTFEDECLIEWNNRH